MKITVPSLEYPTIEDVLKAIPSGGEAEIELGPGIYPGNWSVEDRIVTIRGSGEDQTFLDGRMNGSVFSVKNGILNLYGLTVQNGRADKGGGGLRFFKVTGKLENVTFTNNTAPDSGGEGGGMFLFLSSPSLTHVTFTGNTASSRGGGMYLEASSPTLTNVNFTDNTSNNGDEMYLWYSSPTLTDVTGLH